MNSQLPMLVHRQFSNPLWGQAMIHLSMLNRLGDPYQLDLWQRLDERPCWDCLRLACSISSLAEFQRGARVVSLALELRDA